MSVLIPFYDKIRENISNMLKKVIVVYTTSSSTCIKLFHFMRPEFKRHLVSDYSIYK